MSGLSVAEWRERFVAQFVKVLCTEGSEWTKEQVADIAANEYDAVSDPAFGEKEYMTYTPEESADECMSYWDDDGD